MRLTEQLIDLLICPETGEPLRLLDHKLVCESGDTAYPLIGDIPWLAPNPENALLDWTTKLNHLTQVFISEIAALEKQIPSVSTIVRPRLQRLLDGKRAFLQSVVALTEPLGSAKRAPKGVYGSLCDRAPAAQNLLSYESNIYRDWGWGQRENQLTAEIVLDQLPSRSMERLLVLGAGACRLAVDIHQACENTITVATDINPLLLLIADQVLQGHELKLVEFPFHPRNAASVAVETALVGPSSWPERFHIAFADALKPAFRQGAFDTVVTPWLIDIQPFELSQFLKSLNHYVPEGGHWVNFGSLVFNQKRDSHCYAIEEITALAAENGFEVSDIRAHEIPYLQSPHDAGYRMERVWSWRAVKTKTVQASKSMQVFPEWLRDEKKPIPTTRYFQQLLTTHRMYAEIVEQVDGRATLLKIARKWAKKNRVDPNEALFMVRNLFMDIYRNNS